MKARMEIVLGAALFGASLSLAVPQSAAQAQQSAPKSDSTPRIVLLGTSAGPVPRANRAQPATLLVVGGKSYLVDAGDGVSRQLALADMPLAELDGVFISHLHYDHVLGLGPMMAFSWAFPPPAPVPVWGPAGLAQVMDRNAGAMEIGRRIFEPQMPPRPQLAQLFQVKELAGDGPVEFYSDGNVRVTAVANSHYVAAHLPQRDYGQDRSYSFRFDTPSGSVVFTGDTGPSAAVESLARGCDVLVSEIVHLPSIRASLAAAFGGTLPPDTASLMEHMELEHLTPAEVGKLARKANVKKLVVTHYAMAPSTDPETLRQEIAKFYNGEIVMGSDLMAIPLK